MDVDTVALKTEVARMNAFIPEEFPDVNPPSETVVNAGRMTATRSRLLCCPLGGPIGDLLYHGKRGSGLLVAEMDSAAVEFVHDLEIRIRRC